MGGAISPAPHLHLTRASSTPDPQPGFPYFDLSEVSPMCLSVFFVFVFVLFFCVPQLYLWGSPLLGEIFAYVTVF